MVMGDPKSTRVLKEESEQFILTTSSFPGLIEKHSGERWPLLLLFSVYWK